MEMTIPLMPFPYKPVRKLVHGFYPLGVVLEKIFPSLEIELTESGHPLNAREYLGAALLTALTYFLIVWAILGIFIYRNAMLEDAKMRMIVLAFSLTVSSAVFLNAVLYPKWMWNKKRVDVDRNILFAARHMMIQTGGGVPLFDAMVSISEMYNNPQLDYGQISREFRKVVTEVRGGKDLTTALEDSATHSPSAYYKRMLWQLANSNKAGANMAQVLHDVVEHLSNEQTIAIRNYGSQLNPLAMFYMLAGIIAPTMGLVVLAILSSISAIPINDVTFVVILACLLFVQVIFIGLIKSRRPKVAF